MDCDICGSEMTGFTNLFCPRCEENKPTKADKALGIPKHVGDKLRAAGKIYTASPFGGGPGAGQTIKTGPVTSHSFGPAGVMNGTAGLSPLYPGSSVTVPTNKMNVPKVSLWTQQAAVQKCVEIETYLDQMGWHVGLTGGTLYKPGTRKDVDFIVYPHVVGRHLSYTPREIEDVVLVIAHLCGCDESDINQSKHYKDGKKLFKIGYAIDVFVFGT
jgi:hypothetical protein